MLKAKFNIELEINCLIDISLKALPQMFLPERKMFYHELYLGGSNLVYDKKISARYTIMCLLGLLRAHKVGFKIDFDIEAIYYQLYNYQNSFSAGDLGLLLWLDLRIESKNANSTFGKLRKYLSACNLDKINTWELAWIMIGLTEYTYINNGKGKNFTDLIYEYFFQNRIAPTGLFFNNGNGIRRRFPNFASQIYGILALAKRAKLASDKAAEKHVISAVECLTKLQRSNGGWPWIYDANRGEVVEPFNIYSVHQDAMAPMAFNAANDATSLDTSEIVWRGLNWLKGENEIGKKMIDSSSGFIYRSLRRKYPQNKIYLYANTLASALGISTNNEPKRSAIEIKKTCRPYHMGWILEAWCGRETLKVV